VLAEGNVGDDTHVAGYGEMDFEGAAQTASSVATNSFNPRMRQMSLEIDRYDLGFMCSPASHGRSTPRATPVSMRAAWMRPA
jgi:hypothetical protein